MATASPLSAGLNIKGILEGEAGEEYNRYLAELKASLDARKNRSFDPSMLAMAAGFLAPTQTGGFGESLGQALKGYTQVQAGEEKQDIENAQMRLQIAQAQNEQANRLRGQQAFRQITGNAPAVLNTPTDGGAPSTGAPTTGTPTAGTATAPQTPRNITMEDALRFASAFPENKDMAKMLVDAAKFGAERFKVAMNGTVFDTVTGKYIAEIPPGQTASEFAVPELGENRTLKMTPAQYDQYQKARGQGLGRQWVADFVSPTGGKKTATEGELPKPKSAIELEAEKEAKVVSEKEMAKSESERFNDAVNKGNDAGERISQYNRLKTTAEKPDANKIFGVFENGKFSDAVFKYLESNNGFISAKNIRDIWTDLGLDPKLISDKQLALSIIAQQQFAFSSLAKGQGAISDFERQLFNAMGADIKDRPETIVRKMDMLTARAEFDQKVSRLARDARKNGIGFDDMKDSAKYAEMRNAYYNKLMDIVEGSGRTVPKPSAGGQGTNAAAKKIREELGVTQ